MSGPVKTEKKPRGFGVKDPQVAEWAAWYMVRDCPIEECEGSCSHDLFILIFLPFDRYPTLFWVCEKCGVLAEPPYCKCPYERGGKTAYANLDHEEALFI